MPIKKSKCPNCGAISEIETNEFNVVCRICGVPYMPKEGIEAYEKHIANLVGSLNVDTVNVNAENIKNYALLGIAALKDENHEKCGFYADDILKRDPTSPEGLLLRGYFISNNYSKEEGLENYLQALEYCQEAELKDLIIKTLKDNLLDYSKSNFEYLFETLLNKKEPIYQDIFCFGLMAYFFKENLEIKINDKSLTIKTLTSYFDSKAELISNTTEKHVYCLNNALVLESDGKIVACAYLKSIKNEIDKYPNKKEGESVTYSFFYTEEKIVDFFFKKEILELEEFLVKKGFTFNVIKGGCYIASSVYGSYNAKEVWTLRRFRDDALAHNIFGRLFIKFYYFCSPILLRFFSNKSWFIKLNKKILDSFVKYLNNKGYQNTPYKD